MQVVELSQDTAFPVVADPTSGWSNVAPTVFSAQIAFPSDVPTLPAYDGTSHGNGFLNTGVLDREAASPSPPSSQVTFTKAGTYDYICLLHPFMKGQIVVG